MVGHGGSSAGSYLADPTSPIPSHCASIVATSTLRIKGLSYIRVGSGWPKYGYAACTYLSPLLAVSAIPLNMITIDTLGRRATLTIDFLFAGLFFLLIQICASRVWLTVFIFGVRAFTAGIFNTVYIYTSEVSPKSVCLNILFGGKLIAK